MDAILIGVNTLNCDNPSLTTRSYRRWVRASRSSGASMKCVTSDRSSAGVEYTGSSPSNPSRDADMELVITKAPAAIAS